MCIQCLFIVKLPLCVIVYTENVCVCTHRACIQIDSLTHIANTQYCFGG